jgi:outer membrane protein TolC
MKKIFLFTYFVLFSSLAYSQPLTLSQCYDTALANNYEIIMKQLSIDEADQGVNEAWGDFLPTLTFSYNNTQLSNGNSSESDTDYLDQQSDSFSCRLSQPIFSGWSGISGLKRAHKVREYQSLALRYAQSKLVQGVADSFYNIVKSKMLVNKWNESLTRLQKQREIANAWVEQEMAPRLMLLQVDVEISNADREFVTNKANLNIARTQLKQWLSADMYEEINIFGDFEQQFSELCSAIDTCIDIAKQQRVEIQMAKINVDIARQDAAQVFARNMPKADIDVSWTDYDRDYDVSNYTDEQRDYYNIALNLSFRPFQGGRNISLWRQKKIAVSRLEQQLKKQIHDVVAEVKIQFDQVVTGLSQVSAASQALSEATEAYRMAERSAEVGVVSLDELLDAELRLTRAEISKIDADFALARSRVNLNYAVGSNIKNQPFSE